MVRVLHLIETRADFQSARGAAQLAKLQHDVHCELRTLGRGGDWRSGVIAVRALRRLRGEIDIIHAWGNAALSVATMAGHARVVYTPSPEMSRASLNWLRAIMPYRNVEVVCPSATMRRACVRRGVPLERCHLIRPGVDFSRIRRRRDNELRGRLGFAEDDFILLAAGESTRTASHPDALWGVAILNALDEKMRLLAWGRGPQAESLAHFGDRLGQPGLLTLAEQRLGRRMEFEELLPAADAVLVTARSAVATLPISICMAAGLPIVATATPTIGELLEDRHTSLMVTRPSPRLIARRILDLREDASLQWKIADTARAEAYEFFALTRFTEQWRTLYRQFGAGENVQVLETAPGAALRFHGRA